MKAINMIRGTLAVALLGAGLAPAPAQATAVSVTTEIWGVSGTNLVLGADNYTVDLATPANSSFEWGPLLTGGTFNDNVNGGTSYTSAGALFGGVEPTTTVGVIDSGYAQSIVQWSFSWAALDAGPASLTLDYNWATTVVGLVPGDTAIASSLISVFRDGTPVVTDVLHFFSMVNGDAGGQSSLVVPFEVLAGQTGEFTVTLASVAQASPVPLPAGLPLLASALAGLGAMARRRRQQI